MNGRPSSSASSSLERKTLRRSDLEARRDEKRKVVEEIFARQNEIDAEIARLLAEKQDVAYEMEETEQELHALDDEIDQLETEIQNEVRASEVRMPASKNDKNSAAARSRTSQTQLEDLSTDPGTMMGDTTKAEELLDEALTQQPAIAPPYVAELRPSSRSSNIDPLDLVDSRRAKSLVPSKTRSNLENNEAEQPARRTGTLDGFLTQKGTAVNTLKPPPVALPARSTAPSEASHMHNNKPRYDPNERFRGDNFPWSQQVHTLLRDIFRIPSFRDNQKEIINATLSGDDVFVIMRTGGGKSLTYQLAALLEGRGPKRKVVSTPLLICAVCVTFPTRSFSFA